MDDLAQENARLSKVNAVLEARIARLQTEAATRTEAELIELEAAGVEDERKLWGEAAFGSCDGLTSVAGVIFGLLSEGRHAIILAGVGLAVASTFGMGAGEWLGDTDKGEGCTRRAVVMALATLVGTLIAVIPFLFFTKAVALIVAGILAVALGLVIGRIRNKGWVGYAQTFGILIGAATITIGVAAAIPSSAG
jgi:VIT1/CCC1 family predicted Fe2+/Mn2+ transporter